MVDQNRFSQIDTDEPEESSPDDAQTDTDTAQAEDTDLDLSAADIAPDAGSAGQSAVAPSTGDRDPEASTGVSDAGGGDTDDSQCDTSAADPESESTGPPPRTVPYYTNGERARQTYYYHQDRTLFSKELEERLLSLLISEHAVSSVETREIHDAFYEVGKRHLDEVAAYIVEQRVQNNSNTE